MWLSIHASSLNFMAHLHGEESPGIGEIDKQNLREHTLSHN